MNRASKPNGEPQSIDDKAEKIKEIVNREFQRELKEREQQALQIEDQIAETKKVLNKLRYAIVSNYYKSSSSELQAQVQKDTENNSIVPSGIKDFDQKPIHPSLKKLIGKKPVNYDEILQSTRTTRKAAQEAKSSINEKFSKIKPRRCETITRPVATPQPKPEIPEIIQLTSSRGRNNLKHTLVIGNTSQYISNFEQSSSTSNITHKWMCYLKTKSSVPIERLVKKVRFQLDSSYAPNDVIDVNSPPFQLTRRGYGEFPIKLLIFFKDEVNLKPVQIHHDLILDKKFSGHQTLGNETVTELWTRNFLTQDENDKRRIDLESLIESEKKTNHLNDHDYCKLNEIDVKKDEKEKVENVKLERKISTHDSLSSLKVDNEVVDWVNCHKKLLNSTPSHEEKPSFDINVDDFIEIDDESENFRIPGNLELESKFIEIACKEIGLNFSEFEQSSKLILIKVLKKFVADVVEKAVGDGNVLNKSKIKESLKSRPEFDFLLRT